MRPIQWIPAAALALALSAANPAFAHGEVKPMYGGIVQKVNDINYELVANAGGLTIYLTDHGKPLAAKGITGKLTVLQGSSKTEVELRESGENTLRATGVTLGKGDRLVAVLNNVVGKTATVRFTVK